MYWTFYCYLGCLYTVYYIVYNRLFLLTKNALLKRGPKNSGMGRPPPPLFREIPERKRFFFLRSSLSCSEQFFSALHCPPVVGVALSWDLPSCHDGWELESFPGSSEIERGATIIQELCIISGWKCRKLHWASLGPCWCKFQIDPQSQTKRKSLDGSQSQTKRKS